MRWRAPLTPLIGISLLLTGCGDGITAVPPEGAVDLTEPWVTVAPGDVRLDDGALQRAHQAAAGIPRMRSLVVVREGRLAFERYYGGWTSDTLADVRSVTKSIVSTLTGIALDRGDIASLDQPITDFLSEPEFDLSIEHYLVTIRHLLTMTSGFAWDESNTAGYNDWILSGDHVGYILGRPLTEEPGSTFTYNSAAVHLLGVVLEKATGQQLETFADEVLFGPLGITQRRWEPVSAGYVNGGAGIDLRPRDLARFGQLHLQEGWSGHRSIVPEAWVSEASERRFAWATPAGPILQTSYGFLWWLDLDHGAFFAWGFGGQFVFVVPPLDMVVVATTDWRGVRDDIGPDALQDAVLRVVVSDILGAAR